MDQIPLSSDDSSGPAKIRRAVEHLRTDVVKGLGVKLLDKVLDIMQEEDEDKREASLLHVWKDHLNLILRYKMEDIWQSHEQRNLVDFLCIV